MNQAYRFVMSLVVMISLVAVILPSSPSYAAENRSAYDAIENGDLNLEDEKAEGKSEDKNKENTDDNQAADKNGTETQDDMFKEDTNIGLLLIKLAFYTILVVALIYGLVKFMASRQKKMQHNQVFKTLGGTSMGSNKSLQLVELGGKMYVLGVGSEINLIDTISDIDQAKQITKDLSEQQSVIAKNLTDIIKSKLQQKHTKAETVEAPPLSKAQEFNQLFQQTIENQRLKRQEIEQSLQD
ncbi:flagellar biosynthetic protein FliO [Niallia taxi]|uniref:flagellar biosynthetic protein FliO n=1 Tax=Niallia taxi TaxID=2499688 RepID=UPI0015F4776E|nr:flagellar biosynthetic protein FliO [Niallia taxi]